MTYISRGLLVGIGLDQHHKHYSKAARAPQRELPNPPTPTHADSLWSIFDAARRGATVRVQRQASSAAGSLNGGQVSHKLNREVMLLTDLPARIELLSRLFRQSAALRYRTPYTRTGL